MRYDSQHKQRVRDKVLQEAAKAVRVHGAQGIGVADVMARAGLTHGSFYAHFDSKDDLVAATVVRMAEEARNRFASVTEGLAPADALRRYVDFYLSAKHRDSKTAGCPLPLLANETPRLGKATQRSFGEGVAGLRAALATQLEAMGIEDPRSVAGSIVAEMVGAMALARGMVDRGDSDEMLANTKKSVLARIGLQETLHE